MFIYFCVNLVENTTSCLRQNHCARLLLLNKQPKLFDLRITPFERQNSVKRLLWHMTYDSLCIFWFHVLICCIFQVKWCPCIILHQHWCTPFYASVYSLFCAQHYVRALKINKSLLSLWACNPTLVKIHLYIVLLYKIMCRLAHHFAHVVAVDQYWRLQHDSIWITV